jgi:O-antigen/teichoic acid export membrane protein
MEQLNVKKYSDEMNDFSRYAIVLLALSGLFFLGLVIPYDGKEAIHAPYLIAACFTFIFSSAFFFQKALKMKKKIDEINS